MANERSGLDDVHYDRYSVERIRKKYPNAIIVGYLKEVYVKETRYENRIKFLNECDYIPKTRMKTLDEFIKIENIT